MIRAIAIDDEPVALDILRIHAAKVPFIQLEHTFTSARAALQHLGPEPADLVFLDINMPDIGGLEFASLMGPGTQVIFTTAHSTYALAGFDLAITDFLLKPINFERFRKACLLAQQRSGSGTSARSNADDHLFVKDGYDWVKIRLDDLLYIKAEDNYVNLVEENRQTLARMTLLEVLGRLEGKPFMRVHKSYVVNTRRVQKLEGRQVWVEGRGIPVSRGFADAVRSAFMGF